MTASASDRPRPPRVFATATATPDAGTPAPAEVDALPPRLFGDGLSETLPRAHVPRPKTKTRIRQHLNPLAARWRGPITLPADWYASSFDNPTLPLIVDVGCAKGRFAERLALRDGSRNVLGLEIRAPLVDEANSRASRLGLTNLSFLACNANVSLSPTLAQAAPGTLDVVLLQFCDPWFKKRHAKRRMVDSEMVRVVHDALREADGVRSGRRTVFVQTDVRELAEEMRARFDAHPGFVRDGGVEWTGDGWLLQSPLAEKTEREICVERSGGRVYRALFTLAAAGWETAAEGVKATLEGDTGGSEASEEVDFDVFVDD